MSVSSKFSLVLVFATIAGSAYWYSNRDPETIEPPAIPTTDPAIELRKRITKEFYKRGWRPKETKSVIDLKILTWFDTHERISPKALDKELQFLYNNLNKISPNFGHPARRFLQKHPEACGLMASSENPNAFAEAFDDRTPDEIDLLLGNFTTNFEPLDLQAWTEILTHHARQVVELQKRDYISTNLSILFNYPRVGTPDARAAAEEYGHWLNDSLNHLFTLPPAVSEQRLPEFISYVTSVGENIRKSLQDQVIRNNFRSALWPAYERIVIESSEDTGGYNYVLFHDPLVWSLLNRPDGEELINRTGLLAVDKLEGPKKYKSSVAREALMSALHTGGELRLKAFMEYDENEKFLELAIALHGNLELFRKVCKRLQDAGDKWPLKLDDLHDLHKNGSLVTDLTEKIGAEEYIPGFPIYYAIVKTAQGREVSGMELGMAVVEGAFFFIPGGKLVGEAGKVILKETGKQTAKKIGTEVAEQVTKQTIKAATRQGGRALAKKAVEESTVNSVRRLGRSMARQAEEVKNMLRESLAVDVTQLTQSVFKRFPIGRESFKKFTSLDARLFMRKDATVFLRFDKAAELGAKEVMLTAALGEAITTSLGKQSIATTARIGKESAEKLKVFFNKSPSLAKQIGEKSIEDLHRMQLADWWLKHASGVIP